ncbi:UDP-glucose--hexose-1-phosphate uridylyltransferase [Galbibacter pacificus]|uniref:Galactose-1-phosphate uridylyltransferase n=1 Tax=Galbibacter pacificus TaxID=2996052 RepID=A0ABT6FUV0_9FLAO|nr:UDP-glucose--hexose-1-phosphate uridylyltransferase [Galbibacter pacificus]MDG3583485.1 UDP-glucose--hexose-1-phosphate uridylyltransferase [Galbibacter pacificus]MDG3587038.1 UDP-glucose--hexose-1-phosphate uridylyltransferase [Galbibacter pacificus]
MSNTINNKPHRRYNILTGEWILVSPHRTKRPWQGKKDQKSELQKVAYDPNCYLCPTNERASGDVNPDYKGTYSFTNDFAALLPDVEPEQYKEGLLQAETEMGRCKVVCFSPNHALTLPLMEVEEITNVVKLWKEEYKSLGEKEGINHVQIFENKGTIMGCSNPHPHGQIWSQSSIPQEVVKKQEKQKEYWEANNSSLLQDYLKQELELKERILLENDHFVALMPYWAVWPYEAMIVPKEHYQAISQLNEKEEVAFAEIIKELTIMFDNLFETSFPYSSGIHQRPTDGGEHPEWHFHMSFYPPLLRSAEVKKFMVGYEMFANPQRDITAESAAETLRGLPKVHYSKK